MFTHEETNNQEDNDVGILTQGKALLKEEKGNGIVSANKTLDSEYYTEYVPISLEL